MELMRRWSLRAVVAMGLIAMSGTVATAQDSGMQTARGSIAICGVAKAFGSRQVLHPLDLSIAAGTFVTLLGPSGCGKTTLLRIIAGFVDPTEGEIAIDGAPMAGIAAQRRPIGMVFHLSVPSRGRSQVPNG